ncbi:predicted protein [Arabidopsis lyrata subsp. lyrata]|uniref:Predicted protein n=1 Tax=Arabidopsis lyrata subsp. lyrata TaxID=81972 RepID=D7MFP9_ARALL|nr:predicted protein [Arabidopsis lyrata subsp. lyrata]
MEKDLRVEMVSVCESEQAASDDRVLQDNFLSKNKHEIGQDLSDFNCGLAHVFLQHTSASLTINENYDPDVQADTETFLNRIVPEIWDHCSREAAICSNNILRKSESLRK